MTYYTHILYILLYISSIHYTYSYTLPPYKTANISWPIIVLSNGRFREHLILKRFCQCLIFCFLWVLVAHLSVLITDLPNGRPAMKCIKRTDYEGFSYTSSVGSSTFWQRYMARRKTNFSIRLYHLKNALIRIGNSL